MAQAALDAGVKHVVWSTLEDTREFVEPGSRMPVLMGKYNVPHFDAKGEANRAFIDRKVPTTLLYTSFYWDNLIHFGMQPQRGADGVLDFVLPMGDAKLPGIAAADIGACAFGIFARGEELIGKSIGIAGEHLTGAQMAEQLARALGEPVRHVALTPSQFAALGFPGAADLANMFQFKTEFEDDVLRGAARRVLARAQSAAAVVFAVAGAERQAVADPAARRRACVKTLALLRDAVGVLRVVGRRATGGSPRGQRRLQRRCRSGSARPDSTSRTR